MSENERMVTFSIQKDKYLLYHNTMKKSYHTEKIFGSTYYEGFVCNWVTG